METTKNKPMNAKEYRKAEKISIRSPFDNPKWDETNKIMSPDDFAEAYLQHRIEEAHKLNPHGKPFGKKAVIFKSNEERLLRKGCLDALKAVKG